MSKFEENVVTAVPSGEQNAPKSISRRDVLRRGVTAMPAILTLQSGAALARSSNMISPSSPDTTDRRGRTICLDTNTVDFASDTGNAFDLGEPPRPATVNIIRRRRYYVEPDRRSDRMTAGEICEKGGTYYYKERSSRTWQSIELPRFPRSGVVVSSGAMTSMADHIIDNLI